MAGVGRFELQLSRLLRWSELSSVVLPLSHLPSTMSLILVERMAPVRSSFPYDLSWSRSFVADTLGCMRGEMHGRDTH